MICVLAAQKVFRTQPLVLATPDTVLVAALSVVQMLPSAHQGGDASTERAAFVRTAHSVLPDRFVPTEYADHALPTVNVPVVRHV